MLYAKDSSAGFMVSGTATPCQLIHKIGCIQSNTKNELEKSTDYSAPVKEVEQTGETQNSAAQYPKKIERLRYDLSIAIG